MKSFKEFVNEKPKYEDAWEEEIEKILDKNQYALVKTTNKEWNYVDAVDSIAAYAIDPANGDTWDIDLDFIIKVITEKEYNELKKKGKIK